MECVAISSIKLDRKSLEGIKRIKDINGFQSLISSVIGLGTFANIFLGNKVPEITFNIYQTDWTQLHQTLMALPSIQRKVIEDIARFQILDHQFDYKQRQFWEGILYGCKIK